MADAARISNFLQERLTRLGLDEVPAVDAAVWLAEAGVLPDVPSRPGLALRNLLRAGAIPEAEQRPATPYGRWFILRRGRGAPPRRESDGRAASRPASPSTLRPTQEAHTVSFTAEGLRAQGFVGFERFLRLDLRQLPTGAGVYVVLRESDDRPTFLERNPAGWFKGQDPTVRIAELEAAWPDGAQCVYIGKADVGAPVDAASGSGSRTFVGTATANRSGTKAAGASGNSPTLMTSSLRGAPPPVRTQRCSRERYFARSSLSTAAVPLGTGRAGAGCRRCRLQ